MTAFAHLLVDMAVLAWMVGWSGGIGNPFGMMFLILTALAALALPRNWALAAAVAGISGYVLAALFGRPLGGIDAHPAAVGPGRQLPDFRGGGAGVLDPHGGRPARPRANWPGCASASPAMKASWPWHAAAMAHELNTPLATMTLLADEISAEVRIPTCAPTWPR